MTSRANALSGTRMPATVSIELVVISRLLLWTLYTVSGQIHRVTHVLSAVFSTESDTMAS